MKDNCILLGILVWLSVLTIAVCEMKEKPPEIQEIVILHEQHNNFFKDQEVTSTSMLVACEFFGIKYPKIVTAQAILESGNFKSRVFQKYNNPFGLYNSRKKDYYKFNHWTDAILAYQTMIEYKYEEGDYYKFLEDIGYAEDPNYIRKVKAIEKLIPP